MSNEKSLSIKKVLSLLKGANKLPFAIDNYPSRGQTSVQELYQTQIGKLFLKRVSKRNHEECQIDIKSGTLAEREAWSYDLAREINLFAPELWLIDEFTTVQRWIDCPDGKTFKKSTGKMFFQIVNVFECAVFDWVTGQVDRHDANYLYDYTSKTIIPVDSAHSFLRYEGALPDYLHLFEIGSHLELMKIIDSNVKSQLTNLSEDVIRTIVPLRNDDELDALITRIKSITKAKSLFDILNLFRRKHV